MRPGKAGIRQLPPPVSTSLCPRFSRSAARSAIRASRIWARVHDGPGRLGWSEGLVTVFPPVGLDEDPVDLFQIDGAELVAGGLDERGDAEVLGPAQQTLARAHDEGERVGGEGVVAEGGAVQFPPARTLRSARGQGAGARPTPKQGKSREGPKKGSGFGGWA